MVDTPVANQRTKRFLGVCTPVKEDADGSLRTFWVSREQFKAQIMDDCHARRNLSVYQIWYQDDTTTLSRIQSDHLTMKELGVQPGCKFFMME